MPSADVGQVTRSASFTRPWPIIGRFSVGGNPSVPDTTKTVLRGFSIKLLSEDGGTDLLFENAPVHFAKTLDQMLEFLRVRAPGPDGKANPDAIAAFAKANPETMRQAAYLQASRCREATRASSIGGCTSSRGPTRQERRCRSSSR